LWTLPAREATISFDPERISLDDLKAAVESIGYKVIESKAGEQENTKSRQGPSVGRIFRPHPYLIGVTAAVGVIGFYLGLITLTSDWYNAKVQFYEYRWWILALAAGLGVQATLFSSIRIRLQGNNMKGAKSSLAASGGISTASMAACCAHYLVAFLPALGLPFLSAAVAGLAEYQTQFFLLGVISNLFGIGFMLRLMAKNGIITSLAFLNHLPFGLK